MRRRIPPRGVVEKRNGVVRIVAFMLPHGRGTHGSHCEYGAKDVCVPATTIIQPPAVALTAPTLPAKRRFAWLRRSVGVLVTLAIFVWILRPVYQKWDQV